MDPGLPTEETDGTKLQPTEITAGAVDPEDLGDPGKDAELVQAAATAAGTVAAARAIEDWIKRQDDDESEQMQRTGFWHGLRRFLAFAVLSICVVGFVATRVFDEMAICTAQTTTRGLAFSLVNSCSPLPVQDVVPALLLVVALMWPDLASFELAGIGKVQRRLDHQAVRQEGLEAQQQMLFQTVASSTATARSSTYLSLTNPDVANVVSRLAGVENDLRALRGEKGTDTAASDDSDPNVGWGSEDRTTTVRGEPSTTGNRSQPQVLSPAEQLREATKDLLPWLNYVLKLRDRHFRQAAIAWAAGQDDAKSELVPSEQRMLDAVEAVAGQRPAPSDALRWGDRRELELRMFRQNLEKGDELGSRAANSAVEVASYLRAELHAMGLIDADSSATPAGA